MNEITQILLDIERGDLVAAEQLLPLVYTELRKLAAAKIAHEPAGQTLQATALVHEAYLRLLQGNETANWNGRGHFFAAAAEAMRRILIENARRRARLKHGGDLQRNELIEAIVTAPGEPSELIDLDAALVRLEEYDSQAALVVKLRFFVGLTVREVAETMQMSPRNVDRIWSFARAWLRRQMESI